MNEKSKEIKAEEPRLPEWAPEGAGSEFASKVVYAEKPAEGGRFFSAGPRRSMSPEEYAEGVLRGDRVSLSRAITLVESNSPRHFESAAKLISLITPHAGGARRIGVTGVPGAGKSTFIEAFGTYLCEKGHKVAVLAVDPSSTITRGSILGDKTRMERLSRQENAFIRPSPSGGALGGVCRKSRETMLLCEAAGYDTIIIETVGVGQSETAVRTMADFFLMLTISGAGDDLQGIKKGILENADCIMVNKADGNNIQRALAARSELEQVLHFLRPATEGWKTEARTCSALTGDGIPEFWQHLNSFFEKMTASGALERRRREQNIRWVRELAEEHIKSMLSRSPSLRVASAAIEAGIAEGRLTPAEAAAGMIEAVEKALKE